MIESAPTEIALTSNPESDSESALETRKRFNIRQLPIHTCTMIVIYIILFYTITRGSFGYNALEFNSNLTNEAYRWWSYSLLHFSPAHLYGNMVVMLASGGLLEYGNYEWRTACIYNLAIIGGACGCGWSLRFIPRTATLHLVGASGGIYGLVGAQTGYIMMNWPEFSVPERWFHTGLLVWSTSVDIILSCVFPNPHISYSTHFGGFVTGALSSICLARNIKPLRWENITKIATGCFLGCVLLAGAANLFSL